ncbi:alcohol oxidase, partial [Aureobasidium melanogenum]
MHAATLFLPILAVLAQASPPPAPKSNEGHHIAASMGGLNSTMTASSTFSSSMAASMIPSSASSSRLAKSSGSAKSVPAEQTMTHKPVNTHMPSSVAQKVSSKKASVSSTHSSIKASVSSKHSSVKASVSSKHSSIKASVSSKHSSIKASVSSNKPASTLKTTTKPKSSSKKLAPQPQSTKKAGKAAAKSESEKASTATIGERIFEYVIIGGGTAGTVLANRLSENSSVSVALVEAGGSALDNPLARTIYGNCPACDTPLDWNYTTIPQQHLNGSAKPYHAGRCLGGTSDLNGWTYLRPAMAEFRSWQAVGNPGWSWESLLHYFRKSENLQIPPASQQDQGATYIAKYHGFDGPLDIAWPPRLDVGSYGRALNQTWQSLGLGWNPDANSGLPRGLF